MELLENMLILLVLTLGIKSFCKSENCDKYGVLLYEDLMCKSVNVKGQKCPSKYECNFSQPKSGCLFKGKTYRSKEEIDTDLTYSACSIGCRCEEANSIECAELDCPEYFVQDPESGCYNGYELGKCCSTEQICNSTQTEQCEVDGKAYEIGQQFYPKNTCLSCVCHEDFIGKYDKDTCIRQNCAAQIHYSSEIAKNCAPAYFTYHSDEVLCCPDDFVCPDSSDTIKIINPEADKDSKLECLYGEGKLRLGEGLRRKVNKHGKERNLQCECILPPFLTCKEM